MQFILIQNFHVQKLWFIIFIIMISRVNKLICSSTSLLKTIRKSYGQLIYTNEIKVQDSFDKVPTYRAYDLDGKLVNKNAKFDCQQLSKILKTMIFVDQMDDILLKVKGQGKISFYMTSFGQHACIVGSAAGLKPEDLVYTQYREQGAHVWRGYTIDQIINQCIGNVMDGGKGRQMPVHYGSKQLNNVTVSSPLTTQVPQAAGSGYAYRINKQDKIVACYLGEGAASEGDFPVALNFAATLKCQTLFLCRNNKYAISTPAKDQYASDGIVSRAISLGLASSRVDGNDTVACLEATKYAREYILKHRKPYFLEFMTYRVGDHSTSDNSTLYRPEDERRIWKEKNDPIKRLIKFLKEVDYKNIPNEKEERQKANKEVISSLHRCQKHKFPPIQGMFEDVYDKLPSNLIEQREELREHLKNYGDKYPFLDKFSK